MKPISVLFAALVGVTAVQAVSPAGSASSGAGTVAPVAPPRTTAATTTTGTTTGTTATTTTTTVPTRVANSSGSSSTAGGGGGSSSAKASPLDSLKATPHAYEWHMKPVRVIHARVQSDAPKLIKGRFVSGYGKPEGDLDAGYLSGLDTVNTASVEGALMFVQAECINVNSRAVDKRCERKNNVKNIVFYDLYIVNTNESLAEYQTTWNAPEYGPMVPMDTGRCTPFGDNADGSPKFPPECLQFNGDNGQPNLGPIVGGGIKEDEPRAPYPGTYWFSFPNTCPLKPWGNEKSDACRKSTRKGLCPIGVMPDGIQCTFAYDILGWVPLDDVVGITNMTNPATSKPYPDFQGWCNSSKDHYEFKGDIATNKPDDGVTFLPFWNDPLNISANAARAAKVVDMYNLIVAGKFKSTQLDPKDVANFRSLPTPSELRKKNPPCYYSVKKCNDGFGCARQNFSQICAPCTSQDDGCVTNKTYTYPTLAKAPRKVADSETTSGSKLAGKGATSKRDSGVSSLSVAISAVVVSLVMATAL